VDTSAAAREYVHHRQLVAVFAFAVIVPVVGVLAMRAGAGDASRARARSQDAIDRRPRHDREVDALRGVQCRAIEASRIEVHAGHAAAICGPNMKL